MTPYRLPNGWTALQLRGELERAVQRYVGNQTFFVVCAAIEGVVHQAMQPAQEMSPDIKTNIGTNRGED